jgi:hypothetical protein
MLKNFKIKLMVLAALTFLTISFPATQTYAQEQTPSESAATSTDKPSDKEIKKTFVRALDKIEADKKVSDAKDALIGDLEKGLGQSDTAKEFYKKEADANRDAYLKQKDATDVANEMYKAEESRTRKLERKLYWSNMRTRVALIGGVAAAIGTYLLIK